MKRLAIFVYLICFATMTYAQQGVLPYDVLMRSGKIRTQAKDLDKALEFFNTAVKNYPDQPEAHYWLGTLYHDRSNFKEMISQFRQFDEIYTKAKSSGDKKLIKNCEKDDMPKLIKDYSRSAFMKDFTDGVAQLKQADSLAKESRNLADDTAKAGQEKLVNQLFDKASSLFAECLTIDDTVSGTTPTSAWLKARRATTRALLTCTEKHIN